MGATNSTQKPMTLSTTRGKLRGTTYYDLTTGEPVCTRYARVPYALPPIGPLRWQRPVALPADFSFNDSSTGEAGDFTRFGPVCPQPNYGSSVVMIENEHAAQEEEVVESEDCLYLNIWVPEGRGVPEGGWPVQVYLHGGWLQVGNALQSTRESPFELLKSYPRIIISPTYRLNIFGFLSCTELLSESPSSPIPSANFGFWDQRMALEWVHAHISLFGGNPDNITLGGLSAGAHSSTFQLYYDTYLPAENRIIKRIYLHSNGVGIQPKAPTAPECATQFSTLLTTLNIPLSLSSEAKLTALRALPATTLIAALTALDAPLNTFRPCTDGVFIPPTFLQSIHDGSFGARLAANNVSLFITEVADEGLLYARVDRARDMGDVRALLGKYYSTGLVDKLVEAYPVPSLSSTSSSEEEKEEIYSSHTGKILADAQVHATSRGFIASLLKNPSSSDTKPLTIHRIRISWRAACLDTWLSPAVKACHASDIPIWWLSGRRALPGGFTDSDEYTVKKLQEPFFDFVSGRRVNWGEMGEGEGEGKEEKVLLVDEDGMVRVVEDQLWEEGLRIWRVMGRAQGVDILV